jgi:hypothetical protein
MNEPDLAAMGGAPAGYDASTYGRDFRIFYHCCPVKRVLFCKLGLLHKGFWGLYFGGTLSAVWASGGNFLPDFIFGSWRYHVRRPHPLFTGHGFCSMDEL